MLAFMYRIILLIAIIVCANSSNAKVIYSTYLNDFEHYSNGRYTSTTGKTLRTDNPSSDYIINIDSLSSSCACTFQYNVRIANLHSEEGKRYTYTDFKTGKKSKTINTECGIVWNYQDLSNYYAVLLTCSNSNFHDLLDKRSMKVLIIRIDNGKKETLKELEISKGVNLNSGYNLIRVVYDGKSTSIILGEKNLQIVAEIPNIDYSTDAHFGYIVGKGACADVERIVFNSTPTNTTALSTTWTYDTINQHLSVSKDQYEGIWTYLDRKLDESHLKLGGKYTIAIIKEGNDYDILYLSGSKVNNTEWTCGMLKGKLLHTVFADNYDLIWYDSLKAPFNDDEFATFENGNILTLHFPTQKGEIRFFKNKKALDANNPTPKNISTLKQINTNSCEQR